MHLSILHSFFVCDRNILFFALTCQWMWHTGSCDSVHLKWKWHIMFWRKKRLNFFLRRIRFTPFKGKNLQITATSLNLSKFLEISLYFAKNVMQLFSQETNGMFLYLVTTSSGFSLKWWIVETSTWLERDWNELAIRRSQRGEWTSGWRCWH